MKKFSIIGAGRIAKAHAEALKFLDGGFLFAAYDINQQVLEDFCCNYNCLAFDDEIELIKESDVVIVCTPNKYHFTSVAKCFVLGKEVICEKPLTSKLSESIALKELAECVNGKGLVSFNYRHNRIISSILNDIRCNAIGKIDHVKLEFLKGSALSKKSVGWRELGDVENTSGAMSDLGAHLLDLCQLIIQHEIDIGDMRSKLSTTVPFISGEPVNVDDDSYLFARSSGGEFVEIHTSKVERERKHGIYIEITGDKGKIKYQTEMKNKYIRIIEGLPEEIVIHIESIIEDPEGEIYGWSDSFLYQLQDVLNNSGAKSGSIADGLRVQSIISILSKKYYMNKRSKELDGDISSYMNEGVA